MTKTNIECEVCETFGLVVLLNHNLVCRNCNSLYKWIHEKLVLIKKGNLNKKEL